MKGAMTAALAEAETKTVETEATKVTVVAEAEAEAEAADADKTETEAEVRAEDAAAALHEAEKELKTARTTKKVMIEAAKRAPLNAEAKKDVAEAKEMEKEGKVKVMEAKASVSEAKANVKEAAAAAPAAKKVKQPLDVYANTVTFKPINEVVYCWSLGEALQKHKSDKGACPLPCVVLCCVVLCCVVLCCVASWRNQKRSAAVIHRRATECVRDLAEEEGHHSRNVEAQRQGKGVRRAIDWGVQALSQIGALAAVSKLNAFPSTCHAESHRRICSGHRLRLVASPKRQQLRRLAMRTSTARPWPGRMW
jgi:chemotaxis protein histidine kinase CheA